MRAKLTLFALVLTGCSWLLDPGQDSSRVNLINELARRQDLWASKGIHDYSFYYERTCECDTVFLRDTVYIVADQVSKVIDRNGVDVTARPGVSWPTVDSLFVWANVYAKDAHWTVTVIFDVLNHYPWLFEADEPNAAKDAFRHTVFAFTPK